MAEALLRAHAGDLFDVYSAGTEPQSINPLTIQVLEEIGIPTEELRPKGMKEFLGQIPIHYLIIVCSAAYIACPAMWPGVSDRLRWPLADPAGDDVRESDRLEKFREVRDRIDKRIVAWLDELRAKGIVPEMAAR
jgi:arsenate reductase (thioredoxin)